jgi:hypothetical protein
MAVDPHRGGCTPAVAPNLHFKNREGGKGGDLCAIFTSEDARLFDLDALESVICQRGRRSSEVVVTYSRKDTVKRIGEELRAGGQLAHPVLPRDMVGVFWVILS